VDRVLRSEYKLTLLSAEITIMNELKMLTVLFPSRQQHQQQQQYDGRTGLTSLSAKAVAAGTSVRPDTPAAIMARRRTDRCTGTRHLDITRSRHTTCEFICNISRLQQQKIYHGILPTRHSRRHGLKVGTAKHGLGMG